MHYNYGKEILIGLQERSDTTIIISYFVLLILVLITFVSSYAMHLVLMKTKN